MADSWLTKNDKNRNKDTVFKILLHIAESENNKKEIYDLNYKLLLDTHEINYFLKIKSLTAKEDWDKVFHQIEKESNLQMILGNIYQIEQKWDSLLNYALKSGFYGLNHYENDLKTYYPKEIALFYEKHIYEELTRQNPNRERYKELCRILRKIKKLGFSVRVTEIISDLKSKYSNRRALLEELDLV